MNKFEKCAFPVSYSSRTHMKDEGMLVIERAHNFTGSMRKCEVYVNGLKVGDISNGENFSIALPRNIHTAMIKIASFRSQSLHIAVEKGAVVRLRCGLNRVTSPWYLALALCPILLVFFLPKEVMQLLGPIIALGLMLLSLRRSRELRTPGRLIYLEPLDPCSLVWPVEDKNSTHI